MSRSSPRLLVALALLLGLGSPLFAHVRVLIIDGQNNHDWKTSSAWLRQLITDRTDWQVAVSTTPPAGAPRDAWKQWRPVFADYDVVLSNFNSGHLAGAERWPHEVEQAFEWYVRGGGGFVSLHAANNAFLQWPAYNDMVGLLWREISFGPSVIIDEHERVVVVPANEGRPPGHPPRRDFIMTIFPVDHPITRGFPRRWRQPKEQLTHGQHGPAGVVAGGKLTILTYAHDDDLNENEPMDWVQPYGKGRVYVTMLGHTWLGEPNPNLKCVVFQTLLLRGIEWAATGQTHLPAPAAPAGDADISARPLD